jgi:hypothetical protein
MVLQQVGVSMQSVSAQNSFLKCRHLDSLIIFLRNEVNLYMNSMYDFNVYVLFNLLTHRSESFSSILSKRITFLGMLKTY